MGPFQSELSIFLRARHSKAIPKEGSRHRLHTPQRHRIALAAFSASRAQTDIPTHRRSEEAALFAASYVSCSSIPVGRQSMILLRPAAENNVHCAWTGCWDANLHPLGR